MRLGASEKPAQQATCESPIKRCSAASGPDGIRRFKVKLGSGKQGYCIACIVWIMASICGIKAVTIA